MKISEALRILQDAPKQAPIFEVLLACGFTPLHLQTFLGAHLQQALPGRRIGITTRLYDNLAGNLEAVVGSSAPAAIAVALEWPDLDPRLGYRRLGGWGPSDLPDILANAQDALHRLESALKNAIPASTQIVLSLPTLPLPPVFFTPGWQSGEAELHLQQSLARFAVSLAQQSNVSVVSTQRLAEESIPPGRFDLKSELWTGFPYSVPHADALGLALARLLQPRVYKKGLITDLDDTLWNGLVGEIGPEAISWDLASHHQLHGIYQQLLRSLSEQGVLVGVASKNDPAIVAEAFARKDILLPPARVFPLEVHWNAKSASVSRILRTWNIAADSTVFVDDSPLELAEVQAAHPEIECILFPRNDYAAACALFRRLRDLFGKSRLSGEDEIRLESIRRSAGFQEMAGQNGASNRFLASVNAVITLDFQPDPMNARVLELVNKTNQFNLNGLRYTESEWQQALASPDTFVVSVGYEDKFGPLGTIAVIQGRQQDNMLHIGAWVMSCRAFARRVEHQCLRVLFERFSAEKIMFGFTPTPKNGPLQEFFADLLDRKPESPFTIARSAFEEKCPDLYHTVSETNG